MCIVWLIIKIDLHIELQFDKFDILEALGVTMYSGGCKNATKEGSFYWFNADIKSR